MAYFDMRSDRRGVSREDVRSFFDAIKAEPMIDVLGEDTGGAIARAELGEVALTGGSFRTYLSRLRANGLALVEGDQVRAAEARSPAS